MEQQRFKYVINTPTALFIVAYIAYIGFAIFSQNWNDLPLLIGFGILIVAFFIGCRPHHYSVEKRRLTIEFYLRKNKEIDLMRCETICDPVSRWADIATRPHAIEIYHENGKRYCFFPKDRDGFVDAVVHANKRINCQVAQYNEKHRKFEKKRRRENKREQQLEQETNA